MQDRKQFGKAIIEVPGRSWNPVFDESQTGCRALLYETSALSTSTKHWMILPKNVNWLRRTCRTKTFAKLADSFTPLAKGMGSEFANQNAYDCIQIHGGSGFIKTMLANVSTGMHVSLLSTKELPLQVVAAIRYVTTGAYLNRIKRIWKCNSSSGDGRLAQSPEEYGEQYAACVAQVTEAKDQELLDFCARRLVEMAAYTIMGHLMVQDASKNAELFGTSSASICPLCRKWSRKAYQLYP